MNPAFTQLRKHFALEAKRLQFKARSNQFLFSLFFNSGPLRRINLVIIIFSLISALVVSLYFSLFYSTRYISETQFSIQNSSWYNVTSGPGIANTDLSLSAVQNIQIAYEYLYSYDLFSYLRDKTEFNYSYSSSSIDFFSRYKDSWSDENKYEYWKKKINRKLVLPGATIKLSLTGFSAEAANMINEKIIDQIEAQLNNINHNIFESIKKSNEEQLKLAQQLYIQATRDLEAQRLATGQIEPAKWAENITKLIGEISSTLLISKSELTTLQTQSLGQSPQARITQRRLDDLTAELNQLKKSVNSIADQDTPSLLQAIQSKSLIELQKSIAERLVQVTNENAQISALLSELTRSYVQVFVKPNIVSITTPEERSLLIGLSWLIILIVAISGLKFSHFILTRL